MKIFACRVAVTFFCTAVPLTASAAAGGVPGKPTTTPPGQSKRPPAPPGSVGNGKGTAGRTQLPVAPAGGGTANPTNLLPLVSWLDDAETLSPRSASIGLSVSHSKSLDGHETDAPIVDAAVGITSGVQLSGSLPYYRASYDDGYESTGRGNTYLACKAKLADAKNHKVGIAVSPVLEILSDASIADPTLGLSRVNWGLPVNFQIGHDRTRGFGSVGYFSRGALFVAAALEHAVSSRATVTGALSHTYATKTSDTSDLEGLSRSRTDASGSIAWHLTEATWLAAGVGRTISSLDQNGSKLSASIGISYAIHAH